MSEKISFELDGKTVAAEAGETIWEVAKRQCTAIPHLCHSGEIGYRPDGNCRACVVEIEGERVLAEVAAQLKGAGKWRVEIHAYTDSFGPPATNMELSRQRGERVLGWLRRELGTALPVDVRVVPHGANDLLVQDLVNGAYVPELMAQNRRVVLKISPE